MEHTEHEVAIIGGGPAGLMLAAELRLWDVDVVVIERDERPSAVVRSLGLHARSIELLDARGLLDVFLEHGQRYPLRNSFAGIDQPAPHDIDTSHPYLLGIPQPTTDRLLEEHATASGAAIRRGAEAVSFHQDDTGVTVHLADGSTVRAAYVVGCDGGRSTVRRQAEIAFVGEDATTSWLLAELELGVETSEVLAVSAEVRKTDLAFGIGPVGDGVFRVAVREAQPMAGREVTLDDVRARLRAVAGTDLGAHRARWLSRFSDATRVAETYRAGRVLLAGDAAHVHAPLGGQGLSLGIQDAVNLGFKLAATVSGWAPDGLLDTYTSERRPVAEQVLRNTRAQSELLQTTPGPLAARGLLAELAEIEEVNRRLIEMVTAIGIRYDVGEGPAPLGRRLRDVPVEGGRLYEQMRDGRGVLLDGTGTFQARGYEGRVRTVRAASGDIGAPAVLLRPDGHLVWLGEEYEALSHALARWFGRGAS
jgi:2-polyprenyl-6-methoxyphenol hydroxylase-like FAD-dependent oxidoreductase